VCESSVARRLCDGLARRDFLQAGALARSDSASKASSRLQSAGAASAHKGQQRGFGRAKNVILLYLFGGPSHVDTLDMKPDAPAEVRGKFARPSAADDVNDSSSAGMTCQDLGRRVGLHVERIDVARPPEQVEKMTFFAGRSRAVGPWGGGRAGALEAEEAFEAESERAEGAGLEEVTAGEASTGAWQNRGFATRNTSAGWMLSVPALAQRSKEVVEKRVVGRIGNPSDAHAGRIGNPSHLNEGVGAHLPFRRGEDHGQAQPLSPGDGERGVSVTPKPLAIGLQDENGLVVVDAIEAVLERLLEGAVGAAVAQLRERGIQDVLNVGDPGRVADSVRHQRILAGWKTGSYSCPVS